MAFLTMEAEAFAGSSEESRFPPCFRWFYALLRLSWDWFLRCPEGL
jgi:hypothetical protein